MNKRNSFSFPGVGISSLLVIFAVLCLVVFSLLAISTAKADDRLSVQSRDSVLVYYQAEMEADTLVARLRNGEIPQDIILDDGVYAFRCPISDTQALEVEVRLSGESYQILRWQTVSVTDWQTDDKLPVWSGQG